MIEVLALPLESNLTSSTAEGSPGGTSEYEIGGRKLMLCTDPHVFTPTLTTSFLTQQALRADVNGKKVLDLGCGLGPISIVMALAGASHVWAIDLMRRACELAQFNARLNGVSQKISVMNGNLFEPVPGMQFDLIVDDVSGVAAPVAKLSRWFPDEVPLGGEDGASLTVQMLASARSHLSSQGQLYFPVLSLSNRQRILIAARESFGDHVHRVAERQIPFSPELKANADQLARLRDEGLVQFDRVRSRMFWTLEIYRATLG
jgi:release factor glutamine methyltransferase